MYFIISYIVAIIHLISCSSQRNQQWLAWVVKQSLVMLRWLLAESTSRPPHVVALAAGGQPTRAHHGRDFLLATPLPVKRASPRVADAAARESTAFDAGATHRPIPTLPRANINRFRSVNSFRVNYIVLVHWQHLTGDSAPGIVIETNCRVCTPKWCFFVIKRWVLLPFYLPWSILR